MMIEPNVETVPGKSVVHRVRNSVSNNASVTVCTSIMEFDKVSHLLSDKPLRGGGHSPHLDDTDEEIESDIEAARAAMAGSPECTPYAEVRRRLELE